MPTGRRSARGTQWTACRGIRELCTIRLTPFAVLVMGGRRETHRKIGLDVGLRFEQLQLLSSLLFSGIPSVVHANKSGSGPACDRGHLSPFPAQERKRPSEQALPGRLVKQYHIPARDAIGEVVRSRRWLSASQLRTGS